MVAIDLQEMAPIKGVIQLKGDITSGDAVRSILGCFEEGAKADLVLAIVSLTKYWMLLTSGCSLLHLPHH